MSSAYLTCAIPWSPSMANALPQVRSPDSTGVSSLLQFWSAHPWVALNTIAMPNAIARTFGYDTAVAGHIAINPATGRPLPVATELAMPLAVLVIVGVVASMFAMPLISVLSAPHTHAIGPSYPVDGWRRSAGAR